MRETSSPIGSVCPRVINYTYLLSLGPFLFLLKPKALCQYPQDEVKTIRSSFSVLPMCALLNFLSLLFTIIHLFNWDLGCMAMLVLWESCSEHFCSEIPVINPQWRNLVTFSEAFSHNFSPQLKQYTCFYVKTMHLFFSLLQWNSISWVITPWFKSYLPLLKSN